ncbi:MAG: low molecular weight protein arginine phosphatase [Candidatus Omnitrophica bacterium]|nr:low molecular weight protein arginine phosphatase [Candidatus Omnitrophota bacterium]
MTEKSIKNVLFVCTGNSCRSIMAEAYLKKRTEEEALSIEIRSAGTYGAYGLSPTNEAIKVISDEGIDPAGLGSKTLTDEFINWADVILVMEPAHKSRIIDMVPEAAEKVRYLAEYGGAEGESIPDPIGKPLEHYRECFNSIKSHVEELIKWLKK